MMRLQKEMFSGMQETMKMQSELFYKTMQQLTAGISNNSGNQPEGKLPAQAEKNPKQCGAIFTTEVVDAVTTRSGVNTEPLLKTPPNVTYAAPQRRTTVQQQTSPEVVLPRQEKSVGQPAETQNPAKTQNSATKPTEKPLLMKVPFPERLDKTKEERQYSKFLETMKEVQITIPILDAVLHIPLYANFFKDLIIRKRSLENPKVVALTEDCSAIILNNMPKKLGDPESFSIPCVVERKTFTTLCDLGSLVSVLPSVASQILQLGTLKPTPMTLQLADRTLRKLVGILEDVPVQVGNFAYPVHFVVLEMEDNAESMIIGRPFLATAGAIIDMKGGTLKLQFGSEQAEFSMKHASHVPNVFEQCHSIDVIERSVLETSPEFEPQDPEAQVFVTAENTEIQQLCEVKTYESAPKSSASESAEPAHHSIVELKELPAHLKYAFLEKEKIHPVIISSALNSEQEESLLSILKLYKNVIGYSIDDIIGISEKSLLSQDSLGRRQQTN
jgi:hypothetical protein